MFVLANISQQRPTATKTYTETVCLWVLQQFLNILFCSVKCDFDIVEVGSGAGLSYYDLCSWVQKRISVSSTLRKRKAG
jgi:hypothetical protein